MFVFKDSRSRSSFSVIPRCSWFCQLTVYRGLLFTEALTPVPSFIPELRAEVDIIEQMSSSSASSSSDSESSSGSDDDSSSSGGEDSGPVSPPQPSHQQPYNSRPAVANGTGRPQGSNQLMCTLSKCTLPLLGRGGGLGWGEGMSGQSWNFCSSYTRVYKPDGT